MVLSHINPFQFVLTRWMIGGGHNKWIVINFQEFNLGFVLEKLKISLRFVELMIYLPSVGEDMIYEDHLWMNIFFSFLLRTLGMEILSSIFRP